MTNKFGITIFICIASFLFSFSQTKKSVSTKKTTENISIDAELNEASWKDAEIATDFVSLEPKTEHQFPKNLKPRLKYYTQTMLYI